MQISQFFVNGDIKGAIAYMREHEEFKDILPAYVAIFEDQKYRTYEIPDNLNDILRLYQIYFRNTFYCGSPEAEAADKLRTIMRFSGKRRDITALISGGIRFRPSTALSCRTERQNIRSTF